MKHIPATTQTAVSHAYNLGAGDAAISMAMWAGSQLMALYGSRADVFQEHADIWAEKLKPQNPLSTARK